MSKTLITVENLHKSYGDKHVLKGLEFTVAEGETLAIIGPSGCGKSTTLRVLSGLDNPCIGTVELSSENIGMAFQYSALLNSYTVLENVLLGLHHSDLDSVEKETLALKKLHMLGLDEYLHAMPYELSGGQQKRVSFARAIVNNPKIVLYDEPTAGLDPISSRIIENYIQALSKNYSVANVIVTHQYSTIKNTATKVICLHNGEIVWSGPVDAIDTDQNEYIRQFIDGSIKGPFTASRN